MSRPTGNSSSTSERAVQMFLDRASRLILDQGVIDEPAFLDLESIGGQCGMGRAALLDVLSDLEARRVVKFDWKPADWPSDRLSADEMSIVSVSNRGGSGSSASSGALGESGELDPDRPVDPEVERRRIRRRRFQAKAARLIARHGEFTRELRAELMNVGESIGMSRRQIESAIDKLAQRHKPPQDPQDSQALIAPPALPASSAGSAGNAGSSVDEEIDYLESGQEKPQPTAPPVVKPPPVLAPPPVPDRAGRAERIASFRDEAKRILAENRGMTARSRLMLADAAHDLGLSETDFDEALASLGIDVRSAAPPPSPPTNDLIETEKIRPEDSYRSYLRIAIADKKLSRGVISENAERKMINEGARKLELSQVWARQLLREVASQMSVPLASDQKPAVVDETEDDRAVAMFTSRATPILAQFRGLNAQSRVRLSALADELRLNEKQRERGLAELQKSIGGHGNVQEDLRELAYREFVDDYLAEMSQGILSPSLVVELEEAGEMRFGVASATASEIVRRSAEEAGTTTISSEQATRHLEGLVSEQVGANTVVMSDVRELLYAEGEQWGIDNDEVACMVKEYCDRNRRRRRSERRTTNLVLAVACLAVVTMFGLFFWIVIFDAEWPPRLPASQPARPTSDDGSSDEGGPASDAERFTPVKTDTWWSSDQQIAAANMRRRLSVDQRAIVSAAGSKDAKTRIAAYQELVSQIHDQVILRSVSSFVVTCFANDPSDVAAEKLVSAMIGGLPVKGPSAPGSDETLVGYREVIDWIGQAAVAEMAKDRRRLLAHVVQTVLEVDILAVVEEDDIIKACRKGLARRLMENLVLLAEEDPVLAVRRTGLVTAESARELPSNEFDRQIVDFISKLSESSDVDWESLEPLISESIAATEDPTVLRDLVKLSDGGLGNEPLEELLRSGLARRAGLILGIDEASPEELLEKLGLDKMKVDAATTDSERLIQLQEYIRPTLPTLEADPNDVGTTIQSIVRVSYMQALAMALLVDDSGTEYQSLFDRGEDAYLPNLDFDSVFNSDLTLPARRVGGDQNIKRHTDKLKNNRDELERLKALDGLARLGSALDDIEPGHAEVLGGYLALPRKLAAAENISRRVELFAHWHNVRLALGSHLANDPYYDEGKEVIVSKFVGELPALPRGDQWGKHVRLLLIETVIREVEETATPAGEDMMTTLARTMVALDKEQMRILGPIGDLPSDPTPVDTARALVASSAESLAAKTTSDQLTKWTDNLAHYLAATDSQQLNEVQRTAALDRVRFDLLAVVSLARGVDASAVDDVRDALRTEDREADDVMSQIVQGRVCQLDLMMLMLENAKK